MWQWLEKHSKPLQTLAALATVLVAVLAIIGVKWQIDASYNIQREQSARDIYREFLNISISNHDFAQPDYCKIMSSPRAKSYEAYVEYMLYASEQSLAMDADMAEVFESQLETHQPYICSLDSFSGYSDDTQNLLKQFTKNHCQNVKPC